MQIGEIDRAAVIEVGVRIPAGTDRGGEKRVLDLLQVQKVHGAVLDVTGPGDVCVAKAADAVAVGVVLVGVGQGGAVVVAVGDAVAVGVRLTVEEYRSGNVVGVQLAVDDPETGRIGDLHHRARRVHRRVCETDSRVRTGINRCSRASDGSIEHYSKIDGRRWRGWLLVKHVVVISAYHRNTRGTETSQCRGSAA